MGLFGGIFKGIKSVVGKVAGPIAKTAASVLTHGASDQVLKVLKGRGQVKQVLAKGPNVPATNNEAATIAKLLPTQRLPFSRPYQPPDASLNTFASKIRNRVAGLDAYQRAAPMPSKRVGKGTATKRKKAAPAPKAKSKRAPPSGGLDLKGLSASWKAAGKPGTWQGWIQANK